MPSPMTPSIPSQKFPRRSFVIATAGAGVGAALFGWSRGRQGTQPAVSSAAPASSVAGAAASHGQDAAPSHPTPPEKLTRDWFAPYLNTEFHVKVSALTAAAVKLIEVSEARTLTDKNKGVSYSSFSLTFAGPKSLPEDSQVYRVEHGVLGAMDLFLSPIGRYEKEVRMQAVFSARS